MTKSKVTGLATTFTEEEVAALCSLFKALLRGQQDTSVLMRNRWVHTAAAKLMLLEEKAERKRREGL